ncbi:MopE-related protein, partial [Flavobacterium sp.]|uniref:RCC1 domain-containing protein n=1 Tax=Flavobacterium sp. TaxID=239 RepID=UPI00260FE85D
MKRRLLFLLFVLCVTLTNAQCWKEVSASQNSYTIGIKDNGTLWAWGRNQLGQLGDGSTTDRTVPVQIGTASDWSKIETGYYNSVAIKTNGTLWTWGANESGQLGNGTTLASTVPIQVGTDTNWIECTQGGSFTLALKSNGTLWAWGRGSEGQLGNGTFSASSLPIQIGTDTNWIKVCAGLEQTIALKSNGTLWSFGKGNNGQLGLGSAITSIGVPQQIGTNTTWIDINFTYGHAVAKRANGTIWAWGKNFSGELGINTTTNTFLPTQIGTATDWKSISVGVEHTMALKSNGTLWAWGRNIYGNYGNGTTTQSNVPLQIGTETNWSKVIAGFTYTLAFNDATGLNVWGSNLAGAVFGTGNANSSTIPVALGSCTVNNLNPPTATAIQVYAGSSTLANLIVTGTSIKWYTLASGGLLLSPSTSLVDGTTYYASQTISGVESTARVPVTARKISESTQTFCGTPTVSNLVATPSSGAVPTWYSTPTGGSPLTAATTLSTGTYYVEQSFPTSVTTLQSGYSGVAGVTVQNDGSILTTSYVQNTVRRMNFDGTGFATLLSGLTTPFGIAVQSDSKILIANLGANSIIRTNSDGTGGVSVGSGFSSPYSVAVQSDGKIVVASSGTNSIRRMNADGTGIETLGSGFSGPSGVAVQSDGKIIIADQLNNVIKRMNADGTGIVTLGSGFFLPAGIAVQSDGKIVIADYGNGLVKRMQPDGTGIEVLGTGFFAPFSVFVQNDGNILVADPGGSGSVKRIIVATSSNRVAVNVSILVPSSPTALATQVYAGSGTLANLSVTGTGIKWYAAVTGGTALPASTSLVNGSTYYASQTVSGCESVGRVPVTVRKISESSQSFCGTPTVSTLVATPSTGATAAWYTTPTGGSALTPTTSLSTGTYYVEQTSPLSIETLGSGFTLPSGLAVQGDGKILIADSFNNAVKRMNSDGTAITTLGSGFNRPWGVAVQADGKIVIADYENSLIKRMNADGTGIEILGTGFSAPRSVVVQADGKILVADFGNGAIKRMNADGSGIVSLGGSFVNPAGIAVQADGKILVAETFNNVVKRMNADGTNVEILGSGFSRPWGIAVQADGKILVADSNNSVVKRMNSDGSGIVTVGTGFNQPFALAVQADGKIVVADFLNNAVKRITDVATSNRVAVNVTLTPNSFNTTTISVCGSYTWANNDQTYTASGIYNGTTTNCITERLNLTINPVPAAPNQTMLDQSNAVSANFSGSLSQYQSFTAGVTGSLDSISILHGNPSGTNSSTILTLNVYQGVGVNGLLLGTQTYEYPPSFGFTNVVYDFSGISIVQGQQYTFALSTPTIQFAFLGVDVTGAYNGGIFGPFQPTWDMVFTTYVTPSTNQSFCLGATVANLTAVGSNLKWYATAVGGAPLSTTDVLSTGTYYVSQSTVLCESSRASVSVTIVPNTQNVNLVTACDSYTWANNGQTYTTSGLYTGTTTNCVTEVLNLSIQNSTTYYADADADGFGNPTISVQSCNGAPMGYVALGTDCNDANAAINPNAVDVCYDGIDNDCNGVIDNVGLPGGCTPIVGSLPSVTCGTTLAGWYSTVTANWTNFAQGYRFKITKVDMNTNAPIAAPIIIDRPVNNISLANVPGTTYNSRYMFEIAVRYNNVWQPFFGAPCFLNTPNPVSTIGAQCGSTLTSMNQFISATAIPNVTAYRFRVTRVVGGVPTGASQETTQPSNKFNMAQLSGILFA